ncbi:hypothetical protein LJB97_05590 [Parabacteroides sp. OttesenSCG-928-O15]|nr:hypothetical protein [Parabacteroides sp. OttesenSCG-928-O15]
MNRRLLFFLVLGFLTVGNVWAQWTPTDSLWLNNVLSGKDTLRLNPETMDAIQKGILINPGNKPATPMMEAARELPLLIDFEEYFQSIDSAVPRKFNWADLPPALFIRYFNPPMPKDFEYMLENISNHVQGTEFEGPAAFQTSFVHPLNMLFSKTYRQFYNNSLTAKNLKYYNENPSREQKKKMQTYTTQKTERLVVASDSAVYHRRKEALPLPLVTLWVKKDSIPELLPDSILTD